jgi:Protein of unknown function (DUF1569)
MTPVDGPTRRSVLATAAAAATGGGLLAGCGVKPIQPFNTLAEARAAVAALATGARRSHGVWPLPQVLAHLAQSIEYSIKGFPEMKPALFRATLGRAAFAVFDARGAMSHPLDQPIPGAPSLDGERDLAAAVQRLTSAIDAFDTHAGALQPHFAYGDLDKPGYARAHLMHIAEHWSQIAPAA